MIEQLEQHYQDNYNKFCKKVKGRVGGEINAEDVVQEAYCRALQYIDTYKHDKPLGAWFNTILNNATRDFKREEKMQGMRVDVDEHTLGTCEIPESLDFDRLMVGRKPEHVEILTLHFLKDLTPADICRVTDYQKGQVHMCIRRFVSSLQKGLKVV